MTHDELVAHAAAWLRTKHAVVITEMVSGRETADAIGWGAHGSTLIECKASRSDFLADKKKFFRIFPALGMGQRRAFMAPKGLIKSDELPDRWGLIEVYESGSKRMVVAPVFDHEYDARQEIQTLLSALRRVGSGFENACSVKAYTYETKNTATLGVLDEA